MICHGIVPDWKIHLIFAGLEDLDRLPGLKLGSQHGVQEVCRIALCMDIPHGGPTCNHTINFTFVLFVMSILLCRCKSSCNTSCPFAVRHIF